MPANLKKEIKIKNLLNSLSVTFNNFAHSLLVSEIKFSYFSYGLPLPTPLHGNGARIFFIKFEGDIAKDLVDMEELYTAINAMHEIILMDDPYACINGILYVIDLKDISLNMALKFTPSFLQKLCLFALRVIIC